MFHIFEISGITNSFTRCLHTLLYLPLRNCQRKVFVNFLILFSDLDSFRIILIEISNIASICRINFTLRWNERWRIILLINLFPVDAMKEGMVFDLSGVRVREKREVLKEFQYPLCHVIVTHLVGTLSTTSQTLVNVTLQQSIDKTFHFRTVRIRQLDFHR